MLRKIYILAKTVLKEIKNIYRWYCYQKHYNLSNILKKQNIHKIAIYGSGIFSLILYKELNKSMDVKFVIGEKPKTIIPNNIHFVHPSEENSVVQDVDAIIVIYNDSQLGSNYDKYLFFSNLIIDAKEYALFRKVTDHIHSHGATLVMADLTNLYCSQRVRQFTEKNKVVNWEHEQKKSVFGGNEVGGSAGGSTRGTYS